MPFIAVKRNPNGQGDVIVVLPDASSEAEAQAKARKVGISVASHQIQEQR